MDGKKKNKKDEQRKVAPGFDDERFGEKATLEDIKKGNYRKEIRVFLDENDPS
ncbi:MAG: hypothetical protein GX660_19670 [Clostridiaceae bacterium]|nr:hypothetical protein [Clostridiaceae bacterium]